MNVGIRTAHNGSRCAHFLSFSPSPTPTMNSSQSSVSPNPANSTSTAGGGAVSGVFLLKCHAVLMLLAWMLFAPIAIVFARFQRDPLRRALGEELWFQVHRSLNVVAFLCVLVAFFCVWSAEGGQWAGEQFAWSQLHPLFGLIAVLLCLCQPIGALFRCKPDSLNRFLFNWAHHLGGYLAWLSAVIAISIACTSFGLFASPQAAPILFFVYLGFLLFCLLLMQLFAFCEAPNENEKWIGQTQLFIAALATCLVFTLALCFLVIFAQPPAANS